MPKDRNPLRNGNRMQLGTFGTNGRGAALTTAPDRWRLSWENSLRISQMADQAGLELLLAVARWKGMVAGDPNHPSGVVFDPFTWSAAIAQATSYSAVFATTHAPTVHPVALAKATATIDHIASGRFGLNIVGGWNKPEFNMFGMNLAAHDDRYVYLEEWLHVLRRLWTEKQEFDFKGKHLELRGAMSRPQPLQKNGPPIMNAATSDRGREFACANADLCFVALNPDKTIARNAIAGYKRMARELGREVKVWTVVIIAQRDTRQEAEDYFRWFTFDHMDMPGVDGWLAQQAAGRPGLNNPEMSEAEKRARTAGSGGQPLVGTAEDIADRLEEMADMGVDGCLLSWNDFEDGMRRFTRDVLPLMEKRGLRAPLATSVKTLEAVDA